ncbi:MAG: hypothetical protein RLZZ127_1326 [Planctomycetota bacterium]|jgi:hypothetical protein
MRFVMLVCGVVWMAACGRPPGSDPKPIPVSSPVEERFTIEVGVVPGVTATAAVVRERTTWAEFVADGQSQRLPQTNTTRAGGILLPVGQSFDQVVGGVITNGRNQTLRLSGIISGSATQPWQRITLTVTDAPPR